MGCWCLGSCRRSGLVGLWGKGSLRGGLFFLDKVKLAAVVC